MRAAIAGVGAAALASACCIGPVAFALMGAGALGAAALRAEPYRPWLIGLTVVLVGLAFSGAYRTTAADRCADGACMPESRRAAKVLAWLAALVAAVLIAFPYWIGWFI